MPRNNSQVFSFSAYIAADYPLQSLMSITGNRTVTPTVAGGYAVGRLSSKPKHTPGNAGIESSQFDREMDVIITGTLVAGDRVKIASINGNGVQVYTKFVVATDDLSLDVGVVFDVSGTTATILTSA